MPLKAWVFNARGLREITSKVALGNNFACPGVWCVCTSERNEL